LIPKKIMLAGMTIEVIFDKTLWATKRVVAEARYNEQLIVIDPTVLTREGIIQTYYHELLHHIFFILNEDTLRTNEKLVDTIAHLVHQAAQSTETYTYEEAKQ